MVRRVVLVVSLAACGFHGPDGQPDAAESAAPATISITIEAELLSSTTQAGGHSWTSITNEPGYSGTSYMQCLPADGKDCLDIGQAQRCGPSLVYQLTITQPDAYFVHARMLGRTPNDDSIWYAIDGTLDSNRLTVDGDGSWHWRTGSRSYSLASGAHTLIFWQREAGARVDVVAVTNSAQTPP
jgi:predicted small lipoprotein YifL